MFLKFKVNPLKNIPLMYLNNYIYLLQQVILPIKNKPLILNDIR